MPYQRWELMVFGWFTSWESVAHLLTPLWFSSSAPKRSPAACTHFRQIPSDRNLFNNEKHPWNLPVGWNKIRSFLCAHAEIKKRAWCPVTAGFPFVAILLFIPEGTIAKHLSVVNGCCCLFLPLGVTPVIAASFFEPSALARSGAHTRLNPPWFPRSEGRLSGCVHWAPHICAVRFYMSWQTLSGDVTQQIYRKSESCVCVCVYVLDGLIYWRTNCGNRLCLFAWNLTVVHPLVKRQTAALKSAVGHWCRTQNQATKTQRRCVCVCVCVRACVRVLLKLRGTDRYQQAVWLLVWSWLQVEVRRKLCWTGSILLQPPPRAGSTHQMAQDGLAQQRLFLDDCIAGFIWPVDARIKSSEDLRVREQKAPPSFAAPNAYRTNVHKILPISEMYQHALYCSCVCWNYWIRSYSWIQTGFCTPVKSGVPWNQARVAEKISFCTQREKYPYSCARGRHFSIMTGSFSPH